MIHVPTRSGNRPVCRPELRPLLAGIDDPVLADQVMPETRSVAFARIRAGGEVKGKGGGIRPGPRVLRPGLHDGLSLARFEFLDRPPEVGDKLFGGPARTG